MTDETSENIAAGAEPQTRRSPKDSARYYTTIEAAGMVNQPVSFRIACYNPKNRQDAPVVSLGIGPVDSEKAKAGAKVTPELWDEIDAAMRDALRASI
jgi:hypothetical protein